MTDEKIKKKVLEEMKDVCRYLTINQPKIIIILQEAISLAIQEARKEFIKNKRHFDEMIGVIDDKIINEVVEQLRTNEVLGMAFEDLDIDTRECIGTEILYYLKLTKQKSTKEIIEKIEEISNIQELPIEEEADTVVLVIKKRYWEELKKEE